MPTFATALFAGLGVLLIAIAIPLAQRRVLPNRWYGLRVPATFADREVWYAANARAGHDLIWLGLVLVVLALVLPKLSPTIPPPAQPLVYVAVAIAGTLAITVRGIRHAARLLAERGRGDSPWKP